MRTRLALAAAVCVPFAFAAVPAWAQTVVDPDHRFTFDVPAGLKQVRPPDARTVMAFTVPGKQAGVADEVVVVRERQPLGDAHRSAGHHWHGTPIDVVVGETMSHGVPVELAAARLPLPGKPVDLVAMTRRDRGPDAAVVLDFALQGLNATAAITVPTPRAEPAADAGESTPESSGSKSLRVFLMVMSAPLAFFKFRRMVRAIGN